MLTISSLLPTMHRYHQYNSNIAKMQHVYVHHNIFEEPWLMQTRYFNMDFYFVTNWTIFIYISISEDDKFYIPKTPKPHVN